MPHALSIILKDLRTASDRRYLYAPGGVPNAKPSKALFVQFKDAYNKHLSTPGLTL